MWKQLAWQFWHCNQNTTLLRNLNLRRSNWQTTKADRALVLVTTTDQNKQFAANTQRKTLAMKQTFHLFLWMWLLVGSFSLAADKPNIVLIFTDDLGYGDVSCFHDTKIRTPRLDQLAAEGTRFTNFYVAEAVCSASRAALMTGCYATRVGMAGALNHTSPSGINPNEKLLPEILKEQGYSTGMFGKWHLGLPPYFSPLRNGFDEWLGIPYSNDNSKYHPVLASSMPPLPLYDGDRVIETDADQAQFTRRLTERAVEFIERHKSEPFFLYVPHIMPHVPIFASDRFRGQSNFGLYGDVVEEIDWSVGEILDALDKHQIRDNTLVVFMSDNGPFLSYGTHAGNAGPLREGKLTAFEGGVRVPTIMRWPGTIPATRVCDAPLMTIDLLPTICAITEAPLPTNKLDGMNIQKVLTGKSDESPHTELAFYSGTELHAVRSGKWKLHFPHKYLTVLGETRDDGKPSGYGTLQPKAITESGVEGIASRHGYRVEQLPLSLYDLENDPGEKVNLAAQYPEVVNQLSAIGDRLRVELGDSLTGAVGQGTRPAGRNDR
jgi:arylsulfatase A-like enzyme